jgi:uncharacterized protein YegP (UPF0339 family)
MKRIAIGVVLLLAITVGGGQLGMAPALAQTKTVQKKPKDVPADKTAKVTTIELYKGVSGEFRFRIKDGDGNLLCTSGKVYEKKADCEKVIATIRSDTAKARLDDQSNK